MYCPKCGTRVEDDDYACYMCGARLRNNVRSALDIMREEEQALKGQASLAYEEEADYYDDDEEIRYEPSDDPIEATVREMFENRAAEFAVEDNEDLEYIQTILEEKREKSAAGRIVLITVIVIAVLALCVTGAYFLLEGFGGEDGSDKDKEETLIVEEYEQPAQEEPEEEVRVSKIERARELRDLYLSEEITYDEASSELLLIKDEMYDDADEYDDIIEQIDRIDASRQAFEKGEKQFERGEYAAAVDSYKEVIEEDEQYFERASGKLAECDDAVREQLTGSWTYVYDARNEVQAYVKEKGFDIDLSKMKVPIAFIFKLSENGDIEVSVDRAALNEYIDRILDLAVDAMSKGIGIQGTAGEQVSDLLKYMYGATGLKESVKKELNIEQALDNIIKDSGIDQISSYNVSDARLYINNTCMDVETDGTTLKLTSDDKEALPVGNYEMPFPIKMERRGNAGGDKKTAEDGPETPDKKEKQDKKEE